MKALYFSRFGDPSVLQYGDLPVPKITDSQLLVETKYIGLNYADIYRRMGNYHIETHNPYINGYEAVGIVIKTGNLVSKFHVGDRILFVDVPLANAQFVAIPESKGIHLPAQINDRLAASIGLQGLTADFLAHDLGCSHQHERVLVRGISGGVGQILAQMLTADGVEVYGVTSSKDKQQVALTQGAHHVFLRQTNWYTQYHNFFDVVYDVIGTTLTESLALLKHRKKAVFFGMAGGTPPALNPVDMLAESKSIVTGDLWDFLTSYDERKARSTRLFSYFTSGAVQTTDPTIFSLNEGRAAHELLESGRSVGKILLVPDK